jgi:hypothetical protein
MRSGGRPEESCTTQCDRWTQAGPHDGRPIRFMLIYDVGTDFIEHRTQALRSIPGSAVLRRASNPLGDKGGEDGRYDYR